NLGKEVSVGEQTPLGPLPHLHIQCPAVLPFLRQCSPGCRLPVTGPVASSASLGDGRWSVRVVTAVAPPARRRRKCAPAMFQTAPRGTHRAPGRAVIDYRGLAAPVGRGVGGAAVIGAVSATAVLAGGAAAGAQAPAASTVRGVAPSLVPTTKSQFTSVKLRIGARGAAVSYLQERLNAHGASLKVDGVFGSATLRAVKSQQSRAGIGVDGVVGPKTWGALTGTAATAPSTSQPKLRVGSRGAAVTSLQKQLNASGASLRVDGVFGSATASAVRALQSSAGIGVDAVVGPKTWAALGKGTSIGSGGTSAPSAPPASVGHPKLRKGDRGAAVRTLQSGLNASGASIAVDGVFGSGTASAVRALQSAAGIGVDGVVGPKTWNALDSDVRIS